MCCHLTSTRPTQRSVESPTPNESSGWHHHSRDTNLWSHARWRHLQSILSERMHRCTLKHPHISLLCLFAGSRHKPACLRRVRHASHPSKPSRLRLEHSATHALQSVTPGHGVPHTRSSPIPGAIRTLRSRAGFGAVLPHCQCHLSSPVKRPATADSAYMDHPLPTQSRSKLDSLSCRVVCPFVCPRRRTHAGLRYQHGGGRSRLPSPSLFRSCTSSIDRASLSPFG